MGLDYEFLKSIVLVSIPTIATVFASKYIANSWQIRTEKLSLKKSILSELDNSIGKLLHDMLTFESNVWGYYTIVTRETSVNVESGKILNIKYAIPISNEEQPQQKFSAEFRKFMDSYMGNGLDMERFMTTLRLYYDEPILNDMFNKLLNQIRPVELEIEKLLLSTNDNEFGKFHEEFMKKFDQLKHGVETFKLKLLKTKIKNPKI